MERETTRDATAVTPAAKIQMPEADWAPAPSVNRAALTALQDLRTPRPSPGAAVARSPRALVYLRVSSQRQMGTARDIDADGNSIATQRQFVESKAKELGAAITTEFIEPGTSAQTIAKRLVFRQMLAYLEDHPGEIDYVIIYARSRAFRNLHDAVLVEHDLREQGIELVSATENFGTDEDMAMLLKVLTDGFNHVQVRHNGRDIANKMRHKAEQGGTLGRAKLGYLNVRKSIDGYLVNTIDIDPERAPLVKWAFEAYGSGEYTLSRLQAELDAQGLTSRPSPKYPQRVTSQSQLAQILRDPYYTGVLPYKGEIFEGRHPALISVELFQRVQTVMNDRQRRGLRDRVHYHFLRGLLSCERCSTDERRQPLVYLEASGNGGIYEYFVCRHDTACNLPSVRVRDVEKAIEQWIEGNLTFDADAIEQMRSDIADMQHSAQATKREITGRLRRELEKLAAQEERLLDLATDGAIPTANLRERLRRVELERREIEERLAATDTQLDRGVAVLLGYLDLLDQPVSLYQTLNEGARRDFLETFYATILVRVDEFDQVHVQGTAHEHVAQLQTAMTRVQTRSRSQRQEAPVHSDEGLVVDTSKAVAFTRGLLSDYLVAGAGFEPTTSGKIR